MSYDLYYDNIYRVTFFGHRYIDDLDYVENSLHALLENIIQSNEYVEFLVGKNGDFDRIVSSVIVNIARASDEVRFSHTLILPYQTSEYQNNEEYYHKFYDSVEICHISSESHFKSAFKKRNMYMVDKSDLVICYVENNSGGAFEAIKYAYKQGKNVINI